MPARPPDLAVLCRRHTVLTDADIAILEDVAAKLPLFSEIADCDLFIDCLLRNRKEAVVVSEEKPLPPNCIRGRIRDRAKDRAGNRSKDRSTLCSPPRAVECDVGKIIDKTTEPGVMRTLLTGMVSKKIKGISLEKLPVYQTAVPIFNADKAVIGALISEEKIADGQLEQRKMEELAGEARNLAERVAVLSGNLGLLTRHISDAILIFDHAERLIHANYEAIELYRKMGFMEDLHGLELRNLVLDTEIYDAMHYKRQNSRKEIYINDITIEMQCMTMDIDDHPFAVMLLRDISVIRNKDRELVLSRIILQEAYHRTKNSLQTIASILRLQAGISNHREVKKVLRDNVNRILSLAATHDLLALGGNDTLDLTLLLRRVVSGISRYSSEIDKDIVLTVEGDVVNVTSDAAATTALVVNELVSNALEHAFAGMAAGTVRVLVQRQGTGALVTVLDNGCGFQVQDNRLDNLGLSIVRNLVADKLGGTLEFLSAATGTQVRFTLSGVN